MKSLQDQVLSMSSLQKINNERGETPFLRRYKMSLKELTWDNHKRAEKTAFIKKLLKKEITPHQYYVYLCNQLYMYWFLEETARKHDIFKDIEEIARSESILNDLEQIEADHAFKQPTPTKTAEKYREHIRLISNDKEKLIAHIYVRHMGDLSGGQIIKRFVPVPHISHYEFASDVDVLKDNFRSKLSDDMADEANLCFEFMIDFLEELAKGFEFHVDV